MALSQEPAFGLTGWNNFGAVECEQPGSSLLFILQQQRWLLSFCWNGLYPCTEQRGTKWSVFKGWRNLCSCSYKTTVFCVKKGAEVRSCAHAKWILEAQSCFTWALKSYCSWSVHCTASCLASVTSEISQMALLKKLRRMKITKGYVWIFFFPMELHFH